MKIYNTHGDKLSRFSGISASDFRWNPMSRKNLQSATAMEQSNGTTMREINIVHHEAKIGYFGVDYAVGEVVR